MYFPQVSVGAGAAFPVLVQQIPESSLCHTPVSSTLTSLACGFPLLLYVSVSQNGYFTSYLPFSFQIGKSQVFLSVSLDLNYTKSGIETVSLAHCRPPTKIQFLLLRSINVNWVISWPCPPQLKNPVGRMFCCLVPCDLQTTHKMPTMTLEVQINEHYNSVAIRILPSRRQDQWASK